MRKKKARGNGTGGSNQRICVRIDCLNLILSPRRGSERTITGRLVTMTVNFDAKSTTLSGLLRVFSTSEFVSSKIVRIFTILRDNSIEFFHAISIQLNLRCSKSGKQLVIICNLITIFWLIFHKNIELCFFKNRENCQKIPVYF